jgi:urease accessory protein
MLLVDHVLGSRLDDSVAERLHRLEHRDRVDHLEVRSAEIQRRRFRARTTKGEDVAIALPRDECLFDGAVLALDDDYALLVRVPQPRWLRLTPRDVAAALELAYNAGNLHWRVKFDGATLLVAQEAALEAYKARLVRLLGDGRVCLAEPSCEPDAC